MVLYSKQWKKMIGGQTFFLVFHSPCIISPTDTCYVLSFAIIMLNTSLHNPNVRDKPPVERFISMNRGINEGGDLPEELLRVSAVKPFVD